MAKRKNKSLSSVIVCAILILSVFVAKLIFGDEIFTSAGLREPDISDGKVLVEFIDVGQGDCTLITTSDSVILVDGGESGEAQNVINYLKSKNITRIDCCIATHPHSDHIGSLYKLFEEFDINDVIMPEIPDNLIPTTTTYERFLKSIADNAESVYPAECGDVYSYGDITVEILAPVNDYNDLNNMSVVSKITYGKTSVMLTGDAETPSEEDMLGFKNIDYSADLLKVGHHGSKTSTSEDWLNAVSPKAAIISCGIDNDYGHPHKQLIKRLDKYDIEYFRTDLIGTVKFESDGTEFVYVGN